MAVDAPWFIRNADIQRDLEWTVLQKFIVKKAEKLHRNLATHPNQELRNLTAYDPEEEEQLIKTYYPRPKDLFRTLRQYLPAEQQHLPEAPV